MELFRAGTRICSVEDKNNDFLKIESSCLLYNSRKAARAITDLYEAVLAPSGLHATQFMLLVGIKNYEPVSMSHLAQGLHTDRTTLTRTLKPLQENGWVEISPGADKRVQEVRLTARGAEVLVRALPLWEQAQATMRKHLGQESMAQLLMGLQTSSAVGAD